MIQRTLIRLLLSIGFAFAAAGCATVKQQDQELLARALCCGSLRELPTQALPFRTPTPVSLTGASPIFEFDGRRSHFAAFALPTLPGTAKLLYRGYMSGATGWTQSVYCPITTFLDADKNLLKTIGLNTQYGQQGHFIGVGEVPADARFAVVHGISGGVTAAAGGRSTGFTYIGPGGAVVVPGVVIPSPVPCGPTGSFELTLF